MDDKLISTLRVLEQTSKGQMKYDILEGKTVIEQMAILDEATVDPLWSPQIETWLKERQSQSLGPLEEFNNSVDEQDIMEERSDVSFEDEDEELSELVLSVAEEIAREVEECEKSLDDELLCEDRKHTENFMRTFQEELEKRKKEIEQNVHTRDERRPTTIKQTKESNWLLEAQIVQQKYMEKCRTEKEMMKARIVRGEQESKILQQEILGKKREHAQDQCEEEYKLLTRDLEATVKEDCQTTFKALHSSLEKFQKSKSSLDDQQCDLQQEKDKHEREKHEKERIEKEMMERELLEQKRLAKEMKEKAEYKMEREKHEKERIEKERMERERLAKEMKAKAEKDKMVREKHEKERIEKEGMERERLEQEQLAKEMKEKNESVVIPSSMVAHYLALKKLLIYVSSKNTLANSTDPNIKQYRFQLQKVVGLTVNGLSTNNGEVLIEKISRIKDLLRGKMIMGVSTSKHPDALLYCSNLLALKLVKQGENEVSSNPAAAFPLAALIISLFSNFPDLGELIMAHFYDQWPILVPCYIKENAEMSKLDVLSHDLWKEIQHLSKWQGFKISSDGIAESEDDFLRRMCGVVRLYAAVISSPQLPIERSPHPHGPEHGWAWLARVLNAEPHPTLTAAALGSFLEVTGHTLMKCYGKQFQKLLYVLYKEYVPKLEKCTPASQKGPFQRLVQFLDNCVKSGKLPEPKGFLQRNFWMTRNKGISYA